MNNIRNGPNGGRGDPPWVYYGSRGDPPIEFGSWGHPSLKIQPRGHPPETRNSRDGPPIANATRGKPPELKITRNNSFNDELIFKAIGSQNRLHGRGMPGRKSFKFQVSGSKLGDSRRVSQSKNRNQLQRVIANDQHQRVIANAVKQSNDRRDCFVPRNDGESGMRMDCHGFVPQPRNDALHIVIANVVKQSEGIRYMK